MSLCLAFAILRSLAVCLVYDRVAAQVGMLFPEVASSHSVGSNSHFFMLCSRSHAGADPLSRDGLGRTPLMLACRNLSSAVIPRALLAVSESNRTCPRL